MCVDSRCLGERLSDRSGERCPTCTNQLWPDGWCGPCGKYVPEEARAAAAASPQGDADRGDLWDLADVLVSWGVPRERSIEAANAMTAAGYQQVPPGHHVVKTGEVVLDGEGRAWEVRAIPAESVVADCHIEGLVRGHHQAGLPRPPAHPRDRRHTTPQYQAAVELLASRRRTEELKALLAHVESEQEFGMERSGRDDGADGWQVYANAYGSVAERLGRILGGGLAQVGECSHAIYHADCSSCNERDPEGLAEGNEEVE